MLKYQYLQEGERINVGDEFCRVTDNKWCLTAEGEMNHYVTKNMKYRRPDKFMTVNEDGSIA